MTRELSQAGLNLIKEFEGLRLVAYRDSAGVLSSYVIPCRSIANTVYYRWIYISQNTYRIARDSFSNHFPYYLNFLVCQFRAWMVFSSQIDKSSTPLVGCIFVKSGPFKIFY